MQSSPCGRASTWPRDLGPGRPMLARGVHFCLELGGPRCPRPAREAHQLEASSWAEAPKGALLPRVVHFCLELGFAQVRPAREAHQLEAVPRVGADLSGLLAGLCAPRPGPGPGCASPARTTALSWAVFRLGALTTLS
ncbi:hypothetical protein Salat_1884400 [Sesamum alatum]|uniref:Uncharacterized protein n=1 Tax=Sesamum alatum TaxID=300844 RepID=A0AAE2CI43_9LAMI|nr:hypothetical protein Salat_1884400 [Sesamum alatum]